MLDSTMYEVRVCWFSKEYNNECPMYSLCFGGSSKLCGIFNFNPIEGLNPYVTIQSLKSF